MPSVLLIEDDDVFRDTLANALTEHGYTVRQAPDGEKGMKLFRAAPADLVITDIVMPNEEGIATIMKLRREYPKLGIIAMSGDLARDPALYLKIADTVGATRTLKKPFDLATLLTAIDKVLAGD